MIIQGDALTVLRSLREESVHCVITSPPYYGLRDYGTAQWEGGALNCDHKQGRPGAGRADGIVDERGQRNRDGVGSVGGNCRKCGARRIDQQLGLEPTFQEYIAKMVMVFREVRRVLRSDGTCWLNIGDSYNAAGRDGHGTRIGYKQGTNRASANDSDSNRSSDPTLKPKDLCMIPHRLAIALQDDGWYVRMDIVWAKPNPMPESVQDRPTKSHEYVFLLAKSEKYFYDAEAIAEEAAGWNGSRFDTGKTFVHQLSRAQSQIGRVHGNLPGRDDGGRACNGPGQETRNKRSVWTIATEPFPEAHFATFPQALVEPCIKSGTSEYGCCPTCGAPYVRETSTTYSNPGNRSTNGPRSEERKHIEYGSAGFVQRLEKQVATIGWRSTCACHADTKAPCIVLDPFAGSGTVGVVAEKFGRQFIGIELNPEYTKMAERRIGNTMPLLKGLTA